MLSLRNTLACGLSLAFLMAFASTPARGQLVRSYPLDVWSGVQAGAVQISQAPEIDLGSLQNLFDGNPYTEAGVRDDSTLQLTVVFDEIVEVSRLKLFPWIPLKAQLESAESLLDLQNQSGSYVKVFSDRDLPGFAWDSLDVNLSSVKVLRLTVRNPQMAGVHLGEWTLYSTVTLTKLAILPQPLMMVPNTALRLRVALEDDQGKQYPYDLDEPVRWRSEDPSIASVGEMGDLRAHAVGQTTIWATTSVLSGSTRVEVFEDFESPNDDPIDVKVALVLQDQVIDTVNHRRIHQVRNWADPMSLVQQIIEDFNQVSEGVVRFRIVETHRDQMCFTRLDGQFMSVDTLRYFYGDLSHLYGRETAGTLQHLTEVEGRVKFDYNAMVDYYDLDTKRNNGVIDEVWVYGPPFAGMYESQLMGPGAFWWNSPPLDHPGLEKTLSVMGWNYERGVAEALHSFGHRVESALVHLFGRWDVHAEDPNDWEIFTTIDKDKPGEAQVGNVHFPPNGMSDYDYANRRYVESYADNWKRYPILLNQKRQFNCQEWGCGQRGYMKWWFHHLPRFKGVNEGRLNNWWWYALDYYEAVRRAQTATSVAEKLRARKLKPGLYELAQNYPNPFNAFTTIDYRLAKVETVSIVLYDILGRKVKTLLHERQNAGWHKIRVNAEDLPSGVYVYRLEAGSVHMSRRFLLLK